MTRHISRQTFLHGAIGAIAASSLIGCPRSPTVPDRQVGRPNIPDGVKLRGANLAPDFAQIAAAYSNNIWASMWGVWAWDGWIRPQLDDIRRVGNAVRIFGNTLVIAEEGITLTQYLARWKQFLDYAQSLGIYVYPCGGDLGHWGNYSWAQSTETYAELAQLLAAYPNVIGVDIVNEAYATSDSTAGGNIYQQPEPVADLLTHLGGVVRAAGLPVTYSRNISDSSGWTSAYYTDHLGDYLDFHVYYRPAEADSLAVYDQSWGANKRLIIGEFGVNTTVSSADRTAFYNAVRVMSSEDTNCMGALAWATYDPDTTREWQWGLFDRRRILRTDISRDFSQFPLTT